MQGGCAGFCDGSHAAGRSLGPKAWLILLERGNAGVDFSFDRICRFSLGFFVCACVAKNGEDRLSLEKQPFSVIWLGFLNNQLTL